MSLRPVDSQEDHLHLLHNSSVHRAEGDPRHPNRQCSRHDIPPVVLTSLPAEGGTISPQGSRPAGPKCSPLGGSDDPPIIGERPLLFGGFACRRGLLIETALSTTLESNTTVDRRLAGASRVPSAPIRRR